MSSELSRAELLRYIRAKVDQLLTVMGTLPLRPEELDDETLITIDPIGIVAESFRQVLAHLGTTNERLAIATGELRAIFDTLGAAVVVLDREDRIEDCNRLALDWFFGGTDKVLIVGRIAGDACPESRNLAAMRREADGAVHNFQKDGRDLQVMASKIADGVGQHIKTVMLFTDITHQKETERNLRLYSEVFRHVGEGIVITDADHRIVEVNDAVERILGYSPSDLIGSKPNAFKSGLHEAAFYDQIQGALETQGYWQGEIFDRTKDGRIIPLLESISEVRDAAGMHTHYIAVMSDITSIKETQNRLDFLAHHDALTELPNRLLFSDRLNHAINRARRDGSALGLLFIDLDHFKNVNDSLGHHVGDLLLIEVSKRLRALTRRSDTLARLGGDEFVILMEGIESPLIAAHLAEKVVAVIKQPVSVAGIDLHVGCSIGITLFPEDGEDAMSLLKNADAAMYRAKAAGRDGHVRYNAELSAQMQLKLELDGALRAAVRDGGFVLHYQPICDIAQQRVVAAEALVRWPNGPSVARTPDRFIPVAEESRLILPLGEWILREALTQLRTWRDAGIVLDYISVNFSAVQVAQIDFADRIIALLAETGVSGPELQIELTENILMGDIETSSRLLNQLRAHGVRVAIDDFGTGYSSLSYLKTLPIDILKIDRSFVRDVPGDPNDCAIVAAIVAMAHTLDIQTIAEGIETVEQESYLAGVGCRKVQGFLHAKPLPTDEFAQFIRR